MKYVGLVVDRSCLTEQERIKSTCFHRIYYVKMGADRRIYSDEVQMCFGFQAFNQMVRVFKSKQPHRSAAWRAWKRLV